VPSPGGPSYSPTMSPDPAGIVTKGAQGRYPDLGRRGERRNGRGAGFARVKDDAADVDEGPREKRRRRDRAEAGDGCTVAPEEPVLPLAARRSAVALPTASGVARLVWALTLEMARS